MIKAEKIKTSLLVETFILWCRPCSRPDQITRDILEAVHHLVFDLTSRWMISSSVIISRKFFLLDDEIRYLTFMLSQLLRELLLLIHKSLCYRLFVLPLFLLFNLLFLRLHVLFERACKWNLPPLPALRNWLRFRLEQVNRSSFMIYTESKKKKVRQHHG